MHIYVHKSVVMLLFKSARERQRSTKANQVLFEHVVQSKKKSWLGLEVRVLFIYLFFRRAWIINCSTSTWWHFAPDFTRTGNGLCGWNGVISIVTFLIATDMFIKLPEKESVSSFLLWHNLTLNVIFFGTGQIFGHEHEMSSHTKQNLWHLRHLIKRQTSEVSRVLPCWWVTEWLNVLFQQHMHAVKSQVLLSSITKTYDITAWWNLHQLC